MDNVTNEIQLKIKLISILFNIEDNKHVLNSLNLNTFSRYNKTHNNIYSYVMSDKFKEMQVSDISNNYTSSISLNYKTTDTIIDNDNNEFINLWYFDYDDNINLWYLDEADDINEFESFMTDSVSSSN